MTDYTSPHDEEVLLAEVDGTGATFATATPGDGLRPKAIVKYEAANCSTFTDALQAYARDRSLTLKGIRLAMSVAGTVRNDAVRITNGRWFLSQSGLTHLLGRAPIVINDVSAIAWSTQSLPSSALRPIGQFAAPVSSQTRRVAVIWLGDGLGAACLGHTKDGAAYVLDGEGGHMTASPKTSEEMDLCARLYQRHAHVSFERVLALASNSDARDNDTTPEKMRALRVGMFGSFAGSVALAFGAWDGVYLAGPQAAALTTPVLANNFRERFAAKGRYHRQLSSLPVWGIEQPNLMLIGAAACLQSGTQAKCIL